MVGTNKQYLSTLESTKIDIQTPCKTCKSEKAINDDQRSTLGARLFDWNHVVKNMITAAINTIKAVAKKSHENNSGFNRNSGFFLSIF